MIKRLHGLLVFVILLIPSFVSMAQTPVWRVDGGDLKQPSFIFGTGILQNENEYSTIKGLRPAFEGASVVIFETSFSQKEITSLVMSQAVMKDKKMKDLLTKVEYDTVDKEVKGAIKVGLFFVGSLKPGAISMMLSGIWLSKAIGASNDKLLLMYMKDLAGKSNKEIIGLESADEQMDLFFKNSLEDQAKMLVKLVSQKNQYLNIHKLSHQYYKEGKYEQRANLGFQNPLPYASDGNSLAKMIAERNSKWINKIIPQIEKQPCLIVVNSSQLVFDYGLIALLEAKGYKVTQL